MMNRSNTWPGASRGLTLLEVVTGLALLATLLVSLLLAFSRHADQVHSAHETLLAVAAADQLIAEWLGPEGAIPRRATGRMGTAGQWSWQTRQLHQGEAARLDIEIVRLEVFARSERQKRVLVTVDLAVVGERPMNSIETRGY